MRNSLGLETPSHGVRTSTTRPPSLSPPTPTVRSTPQWRLQFASPLVSLPTLLLVVLALRNHPHPHRHEDRFLWQTNVLFNIIIVYLAIETASPLLFRLIARFGSRTMDVGLHCDLIATWSFAVACTLPIEFYAAAGDVTISRLYMSLLYVGLAALFVLRVFFFVSFVSTL